MINRLQLSLFVCLLIVIIIIIGKWVLSVLYEGFGEKRDIKTKIFQSDKKYDYNDYLEYNESDPDNDRKFDPE